MAWTWSRWRWTSTAWRSRRRRDLPPPRPKGCVWQLMEGVYACGLDWKVAALDLAVIDPSRDIKDFSACTGCAALLAFLGGLQHRLHGDQGC